MKRWVLMTAIISSQFPQKLGSHDDARRQQRKMGSKTFHRREGRAVTQPAASERALTSARSCSPTPTAAGQHKDQATPHPFPKVTRQTLHAPLPLISIQVSIFLAVVIIRNYTLDCSSRTTLGKRSVSLRRGSTKRGQGAKPLPANGTRQKAPCLCLLRRSLVAPEDSHPSINYS